MTSTRSGATHSPCGERRWVAGAARTWARVVLCAGAALTCVVVAAAEPLAPSSRPTPTPTPTLPAPQARVDLGMAVAGLSLTPLAGDRLIAGDWARVTLQLEDAAGRPLRAVVPRVWAEVREPTLTASGVADLARAPKATGATGATSASTGAQSATCTARQGSTPRQSMGSQPVLDLNSYFILVLNEDPTVSVVHPHQGLGGSNLVTKFRLPRPGLDLLVHPDRHEAYVSMPLARAVAVLDLERLRLVRTIDVDMPAARLALQPDGRYLWVGSEHGSAGRLVAIDVSDRRVAAALDVPPGHHEFAFTADSTRALVTHRAGRALSVVDTSRFTQRTVEIDGEPIQPAFSGLSGRAVVTDGLNGRLLAIEPDSGRVMHRLVLQPGAGVVRLSPEGRHALVLNAAQRTVSVVDLASMSLRWSVSVPGVPYQVSASRELAHLRLLGTNRVATLRWADVAQPQAPDSLGGYAVASQAPEAGRQLGFAAQISPAGMDAATLVLSAADKSIAYYMDGMNAPMGSFSTYGHEARGIAVAGRQLREVAPGRHEALVRLPLAGVYQFAARWPAPDLQACFTVAVDRAAATAASGGGVAWRLSALPATLAVGDTLGVDLHQIRPEGPTAPPALLAFDSTGRYRQQVPSERTATDRARASLVFHAPGQYQVQVLQAGASPEYRSISVVAPDALEP